MKVRKKPIVVEAHRWLKNGDHPRDRVGETEVDPAYPDKTYTILEGQVVRFFRHPDPAYASDKPHDACGRAWHDHGWIDTLEGGHIVCPGDVIITGIHGEDYPCKYDIFWESYELVEH